MKIARTMLPFISLFAAMVLPAFAADTNIPASVFAPLPTNNLCTNFPAWAIGPFTRVNDGQGILKPDTNAVFDCPMSKQPIFWEKAWVYNPAAVVRDGKIIVLYRSQAGPGNTCSRIGYAESEDGVNFKKEPAPVIFPTNDDQKSWEWSGSDRIGGCEDPRITESPDGFYVLTYSQYNGGKYRLGLATSKDLKHWTKRGGAFAGSKWENAQKKSASIVNELKDGKLVAAKINDKYWMYFGDSGIFAATSDDLIHWTPIEDSKGGFLRVMSTRLNTYFDNLIIEVGPNPVLTKDGIILFYNGVNKKGTDANPSYEEGGYSGGETLFDAKDPTKLIDRLDKPFITPTLPWEKTGLYKWGTTFIEGLVFFKNQWHIFYGCSDSFVGSSVAPAHDSESTPPQSTTP